MIQKRFDISIMKHNILFIIVIPDLDTGIIEIPDLDTGIIEIPDLDTGINLNRMQKITDYFKSKKTSLPLLLQETPIAYSGVAQKYLDSITGGKYESHHVIPSSEKKSSEDTPDEEEEEEEEDCYICNESARDVDCGFSCLCCGEATCSDHMSCTGTHCMTCAIHTGQCACTVCRCHFGCCPEKESEDTPEDLTAGGQRGAEASSEEKPEYPPVALS